MVHLCTRRQKTYTDIHKTCLMAHPKLSHQEGQARSIISSKSSLAAQLVLDLPRISDALSSEKPLFRTDDALNVSFRCPLQHQGLHCLSGLS